MTNREIYPNAPAALVAVEVRHPESEALSEPQQSQIMDQLVSHFPIPQPIQSHKITTTVGGSSSAITQTHPRYATRDQMTSVTFSTEAIVVETTRHQNFDHLLGLVNLAVTARQKAAPVSGFMRIGLRYVNEIRVPDLESGIRGWGDWINENLLGPIFLATELGLVPEQWQGAAMFDQGGGKKLVVRHGPRDGGYAFAPVGPLQRQTPPPGPFFLLDIDSFWAVTNEVPEFMIEKIKQFCIDLHKPAHTLFESLITERLREEVLRRV